MKAERDQKLPSPPRSGVFVISVVAETTGLHPQTLRSWEREGLVSPQRTPGGTRRYSSDDMARVRRICQLTSQGINLAGVKEILILEKKIKELQQALSLRQTS